MWQTTALNVKQHALNYLQKKAEADKEKAQLSLALLLEKSAGIGDHSTEDYYKNLDEALATLVDADDRLEALAKYFPHPVELLGTTSSTIQTYFEGGLPTNQ